MAFPRGEIQFSGRTSLCLGANFSSGGANFDRRACDFYLGLTVSRQKDENRTPQSKKCQESQLDKAVSYMSLKQLPTTKNYG